jgi:hypothetical protein
VRVKKGLEYSWGIRKPGEPSGYGDIDSDDETQMSLLAQERKEQAREMRQRRPLIVPAYETKFVLLKDHS